MNLISILPFFVFKWNFYNCLVINELKIDSFLNLVNFPEQKNDKSFLDVDVANDLLPTITRVFDVTNEPSQNSKTNLFLDKNQKSYKCWLESEALINKENNSGHFSEIIKSIVKNRKKSCYYFKAQKWIYEYCHLKSARQVSRTKINDNHEEFSLGRYYPPRQELVFHPYLNHISTEFFDGTLCLLTNKPRRTRIIFVCANDKKVMYLVNVVETSACFYDFIIHIPELCEYIPIHAKDKKQKYLVKCLNYSKKQSKSTGTIKSTLKNERLDELDQILNSIESTYKESSILKNYKELLTKASEKLKSYQLAKEFKNADSDNGPLLDLLSKLKPPSEDENEKEESEEKTHEKQVK